MKYSFGQVMAVGAVSTCVLWGGSSISPAAASTRPDFDALKSAVSDTLGRVTSSEDQNNALIKAVASKDPVAVSNILVANGMDPKLLMTYPIVFKGKPLKFNAITFSHTGSGDHGTLNNVYYPGVGWVDIHLLWASFWD